MTYQAFKTYPNVVVTKPGHIPVFDGYTPPEMYLSVRLPRSTPEQEIQATLLSIEESFLQPLKIKAPWFDPEKLRISVRGAWDVCANFDGSEFVYVLCVAAVYLIEPNAEPLFVNLN